MIKNNFHNKLIKKSNRSFSSLIESKKMLIPFQNEKINRNMNSCPQIDSNSSLDQISNKFQKDKNFYTSYSKLSEVKLITIGLASSQRIKQWAEKTLPNGKILGEVINANTLHHKTFKPQKGGLFCERIFGPLKDFECACGKPLKFKKENKLELLKGSALIVDSNLPKNGESRGVGSSPSSPKKAANSSQRSEGGINVDQGSSSNGLKNLLNLNKSILGGPSNSDLSDSSNIQGLSVSKTRNFCNICEVEYTWSVMRRYQLGYINLISPVTHVWYLKGNPSYLSILLDMKKRHLEYIVYCSETLTLENSLKGGPISRASNSSDIVSSWKKLKLKIMQQRSFRLDKNLESESLSLERGILLKNSPKKKEVINIHKMALPSKTEEFAKKIEKRQKLKKQMQNKVKNFRSWTTKWRCLQKNINQKTWYSFLVNPIIQIKISFILSLLFFKELEPSIFSSLHFKMERLIINDFFLNFNKLNDYLSYYFQNIDLKNIKNLSFIIIKTKQEKKIISFENKSHKKINLNKFPAVKQIFKKISIPSYILLNLTLLREFKNNLDQQTSPLFRRFCRQKKAGLEEGGSFFEKQGGKEKQVAAISLGGSGKNKSYLQPMDSKESQPSRLFEDKKINISGKNLKQKTNIDKIIFNNSIWPILLQQSYKKALIRVYQIFKKFDSVSLFFSSNIDSYLKLSSKIIPVNANRKKINPDTLIKLEKIFKKLKNKVTQIDQKIQVAPGNSLKSLKSFAKNLSKYSFLLKKKKKLLPPKKSLPTKDRDPISFPPLLLGENGEERYQRGSSGKNKNIELYTLSNFSNSISNFILNFWALPDAPTWLFSSGKENQLNHVNPPSNLKTPSMVATVMESIPLKKIELQSFKENKSSLKLIKKQLISIFFKVFLKKIEIKSILTISNFFLKKSKKGSALFSLEKIKPDSFEVFKKLQNLLFNYYLILNFGYPSKFLNKNIFTIFNKFLLLESKPKKIDEKSNNIEFYKIITKEYNGLNDKKEKSNLNIASFSVSDEADDFLFFPPSGVPKNQQNLRNEGVGGVNTDRGAFSSSKKLYNNVYSLSHRERWEVDNDWNFLYYYITGPRSSIEAQNMDKDSNLTEYPDIEFNFLSMAHLKTPKIIANYKNNLQFGLDQNPLLNLPSEIQRVEKNSLFSGPGIIQLLLNEFTFFEIKKMDKQNRILLYQLNKLILKLKKKVLIPNSTKNNIIVNRVLDYRADKKELKESYKKRDLLIRRTKLVRKLFIKESPPQATILNVLPVLPPDLRPIVKIGGQVAASDLNRLYQRVIYRNDRLKKFLKDPATSHSYEMKYAQRLLQEAVDNLIQNGKSGVVTEKDSRGRALKSLSDILKGKQGRFRQYLLGKRVDYSGRSVIVVGPRLRLHECGLPKEMALELYLPFLLKRILNDNLARTVVGAKMLIKTKPALIWELLREIMQTCPVLLNRAPTLHRLGIQAFQPKLIDGRAILLHPLVCSAFNADFDGDQMAVHVPITVEARAEAWKLMLSRNSILSPATGDPLAIPSQDMVLGCYYLTTNLVISKTNTILKNNEKNGYEKKMASKIQNLGNGFYFSKIDHVLKAYELKKIDLHANIWLKWSVSNFIENGLDQEEPIEMRLDSFGNWKEIYSQSQKRYNFKNICLVQYILTTPGKIIFNEMIQKALK